MSTAVKVEAGVPEVDMDAITSAINAALIGTEAVTAAVEEVAPKKKSVREKAAAMTIAEVSGATATKPAKALKVPKEPKAKKVREPIESLSSSFGTPVLRVCRDKCNGAPCGGKTSKWYATTNAANEAIYECAECGRVVSRGARVGVKKAADPTEEAPAVAAAE